jgi:hypothetical protein
MVIYIEATSVVRVPVWVELYPGYGSRRYSSPTYSLFLTVQSV